VFGTTPRNRLYQVNNSTRQANSAYSYPGYQYEQTRPRSFWRFFGW
jgi:hypothetical protein